MPSDSRAARAAEIYEQAFQVSEGADTWLTSLVMTVTALREGDLQGVANLSDGEVTAEGIRARLDQLGLHPAPISHSTLSVRYGIVSSEPDHAVTVAVAEGTPRDIGILIAFTRDAEMDLWDGEILEIDDADALMRRHAADEHVVDASQAE